MRKHLRQRCITKLRNCFKDIKNELISKGYLFKSKGDTEVLISAWIEWGENMLNKLDGMFSFAIYDRKNKAIFLARDRFGIKPLYYSKQGNMFSFASEQKSILANPDFKANLDKETLIEYFTFQNLFTNKTLFKNVKTPESMLKLGEIGLKNHIKSIGLFIPRHFYSPAL